MFETNKYFEAVVWLSEVRDIKRVPHSRRLTLLVSGATHVESLVHLVRWMAVRFTPSGGAMPPRFPPPLELRQVGEAPVAPDTRLSEAEQIIGLYLHEMELLESDRQDNLTPPNLPPAQTT